MSTAYLLRREDGATLGRRAVLAPQVVPYNQPQVQDIEYDHDVPPHRGQAPGRHEVVDAPVG